jgi:hypothetical protein
MGNCLSSPSARDEAYRAERDPPKAAGKGAGKGCSEGAGTEVACTAAQAPASKQGSGTSSDGDSDGLGKDGLGKDAGTASRPASGCCAAEAALPPPAAAAPAAERDVIPGVLHASTLDANLIGNLLDPENGPAKGLPYEVGVGARGAARGHLGLGNWPRSSAPPSPEDAVGGWRLGACHWCWSST